jgi:hypothetical protein
MSTTRQMAIRGVAVAAALVVLALVVALVFGDRNSDAPVNGESSAQTSIAPSPSAAPSVTPEAATPTPVADGMPPEMPAVPLDGRAEAGNGLVALLPRIEAIQGTGTGPGNIAGPSLRVTVRLENGTAGPVFLDAVAVNVYHGEERTPASPLDDPSSSPFQGTLAAGKSAEGVYVVRVPESARGDVTIEVGYEAGAPLLIFHGSVD